MHELAGDLPLKTTKKKIPASAEPAEGMAPIGIPGLDEVLNGGMPAHHVYLIDGSPGTGKTTLALQFLLEGVKRGERVLYVALSETAEEIDAVAGSHGWMLEGIDVYELSPEESLQPDAQYTVFHPSELE